MKWYKKVAVILCNVVLLNVANQCLATTDTITYTKNNNNYIDKIYYVESEEKQEFLNNLERKITVDENEYVYVDAQIENQDEKYIIDIETSKTTILSTNIKSEIIETLGKTIEYNKDNYIGTYALDENSIIIKTINNGYYDQLIDKTVEYNNLEKNDLDLIPKQIQYKGRVLDLLNTSWETTDTTNIGNVEVPSEYKAICYYATKERIYRANTYLVTANYVGTAEKKIEKPLKITITYEKQIEENGEVIEEKYNNVIFCVGGTTIIVFFGALLFFGNRVKVYNNQNGKWSYLGKVKIINKKINLSKFQNKEITNKYRVELTKYQARKYNGKNLTICKAKNKVNYYVRNIDGNCDFEIRI